MSLRQSVQSDLTAILNDSMSGFGWSITLTSPDGVVGDLTGISTDIGVSVDPDTGQVVSGRTASVSIMSADIAAAGFESEPVGIADRSVKPWVVTFDDIDGFSVRFKVTRDIPDRAVGLIVLMLELYQ